MAYCDTTYAGTYLAGSLFADSWTATASAKQTTALECATRLIKQFVTFYDGGEPFYYDETVQTVPDWLKDATCEEANYLLTLARDPAFDKKLTLGISSTDGTVFSREFTPDILCVGCRSICEREGGEVSADAIGGNHSKMEIGTVVK